MLFYWQLLSECRTTSRTTVDSWIRSVWFPCQLWLTDMYCSCFIINPLDSKGNYGVTLNNTKLVHWPLMGGLLHLVQRRGPWAGCGAAQSPRRSTKCNSRVPINGQCTNIVLLYDDMLLCDVHVAIKALMRCASGCRKERMTFSSTRKKVRKRRNGIGRRYTLKTGSFQWGAWRLITVALWQIQRNNNKKCA